MNTLKFITNINCGGCKARVSPFLDTLKSIKWDVDINNPEKILTIEGDISADDVKAAVSLGGFFALEIN